MSKEEERLLEKVEKTLQKQLELLGNSKHFAKMSWKISSALHAAEYARESLDGVHDDFMPNEEREKVSDYLYEHYDGDNELDTCDMSDKELLDMYENWLYEGETEQLDRAARLRSIYDGMRLMKVVNEESI